MNLPRQAIAAMTVVLGLAACATDEASNVEPAEAARIEYPTVEAALAAVRARPGVTESQSDGWTVIEDKARRETWLFSPAGHFAHPAMVKRTVVRRAGETRTQTAARCGAGQAACDRLVAQFDAADKKAAPQQRVPEIPRSGTRY